MKRFLVITVFALIIFTNLSCTEVGKNNQEANGDIIATTPENSNVANEEKIPEAANSVANNANDTADIKDPNSPEGLVAELYKQTDNENSPFFQDKNRELVDKYFTKNLADMIWKDSVDSGDEVGALDFDPLYNAQDTEIAELKINKAEVKDEKAIVPVTFLNFGDLQTIKFMLAKENGAWKIEDINYGENTLIEVYKENNVSGNETPKK